MQTPKSTEILLVALNARYAHTSFAARYLLANLGKLQNQADLLEFDLQIQPRTAIEKILARHPRIVGIGCYIWNIDLATQIAALLKQLRPDLKLILGGPEISHEIQQQEIVQYADHIICGEGEIEFQKLCKNLLNAPPASCGLPRIIHAEPVDVTQIKLPYDLYSDTDIAHRALYVEASRGCPFRCEYCMSSLAPTVRYFPQDRFLAAMQRLLDRGARTFKFVDRSFNIDIPFALKIIHFFRERYINSMMLHFEVIPDRLPGELMNAIAACPPGMLQLEIGIQTFNQEVAHRIQRPLNIEKIETNLHRLRAETSVHIHSDLIAGLPGEDLQSFESGFNRLLALNPQEIQLGILKRLRGAPIDRHTRKWKMLYSPHAPYEILQTAQISFEKMQRLQRFARYWNLTVNNGQFLQTAPLLWKQSPDQGRQDLGDTAVPPASSGHSPFAAFMHWSDWLYAKTNTTANLHMVRLAKLLFEYLTTEREMDGKTVATALWNDYSRGNRPDVPGFLKKYGFGKNPFSQGRQDVGDTTVPPASSGQQSVSNGLHRRQTRHLK